MNGLIKRVLVGVLTGIIASALLYPLIASTPEIVKDGLLGGLTTMLVAGALIGVSFALFFRSAYYATQDSQAGTFTVDLSRSVMVGLTLGLTAWVILALGLIPVLMGGSPLWQAVVAATTFPQLIFLLLLGALNGLLYCVAYALLAERLGFAMTTEMSALPEITKRIVILGGGYAGVTAAETLERELADQPHVGIWLVSETNHLLHTPMLSEVSASAVNPQNISPPLRSFFNRVQVIQGDVESVDMDERVVHLAPDTRSPNRVLAFDHLVLTVGGVPNFFGNEDVAREAFTFKSLEDAMVLRNHIIDMFERADFERDVALRRAMLTFVVTGGGFAGVELIGGLNDFARGIAPFYPNVPPDEVRMVLVHSRDRILPELSEGLGLYAQEKLAQRGVEFKLKLRVSGARPGVVLLGDEELNTHTLVWTAGNKPSPMLETLGLDLNRGRIEVNAELVVSDAHGLWAAGDCALIPDLSTGGFAPPTAQHATREGKVLGYNVAAAIKGKPYKTFNFKTLGSLAALGHQIAVAEVFGYRFSGFFAWLMWRAIYLSKLPTLDKQVRVFLDWVLDIFFPADIVQTITFSRPDAAERMRERKSMLGSVESSVESSVEGSVAGSVEGQA
ncbi:MAG: NAD(P)/FAD-dependent oxidoreductase [Chloroflexota bacterium]